MKRKLNLLLFTVGFRNFIGNLFPFSFKIITHLSTAEVLDYDNSFIYNRKLATSLNVSVIPKF